MMSSALRLALLFAVLIALTFWSVSFWFLAGTVLGRICFLLLIIDIARHGAGVGFAAACIFAAAYVFQTNAIMQSYPFAAVDKDRAVALDGYDRVEMDSNIRAGLNANQWW